MKRWQQDINLMNKRWKEEIQFHTNETFNKVESNCHCLRGMGIMRKRRPYGSCSPNQHCGCCEMERSWHKQEKKKERVQGKLELRYEIK